MSRLVIDVTSEQHKQIKMLAAVQGKTIKNYILDSVFDEKKHSEAEAEAWAELKSFLNDRIRTSQDGNLSNKSMMDIARAKAKELNM